MDDSSAKQNISVRWIVAAAVGGALIGSFAVAGALTGSSRPGLPEQHIAPAALVTGASDSGTTAHAGETPLTGDTAEKVKAAALAAVPGATVDQVETDADGSPYEAHLTKPDGSPVTVKVDKDFKVTSVDDH